MIGEDRVLYSFIRNEVLVKEIDDMKQILSVKLSVINIYSSLAALMFFMRSVDTILNLILFL